MRENHTRRAFFITSLLYLGIFGAYFYLTDRHPLTTPDTKPEVVKLSLEAFVPPPQISPPQLPQELELPDFSDAPKPPQIETSPLPAPRFKPPSKPKPKPRPKKRKTARTPPVPAAVKPPTSTYPAPPSIAPPSPAKRQKFLAKIRDKIDRAKTYPRIAKKRGIEGEVRLFFTVTANGELRNLRIEGPRVFHTSARRAVEAAFPVDTSGMNISFPLEIRLKLRYQIH